MRTVLAFFDLNERAYYGHVGPRTDGDTGVVRGAHGSKSEPQLVFWQQLLCYLGVVVGVVGSQAVNQYSAGKAISGVSVGEILVALVVGLVLLPIAYEKLRVDPTLPLLFQVGLFAQQGVFWQTLLIALGKTVSH